MHPVSLTACWTAALRARETARHDRLFADPLAEGLAGPEGQELVARMESREVATQLTIPIRTRFFDDALLRIAQTHTLRQAVLLAAGLDTRAFRLDLPPDLTFFELDRPQILELKEQRLRALGAHTARCRRRAIATDLFGPWADDLRKAGFSAQPTVWLAEGLLAYLSAPQVRDLLETVTSLCNLGDFLLADVPGASLLHSPQLAQWLSTLADHGMAWHFGTEQPEMLLAGHGWAAKAAQYGERGANFGRWPWPPTPRSDARWPRSYLVVARRAAT